MSRAQTIRFALQVVGAVAGMLLFLMLPLQRGSMRFRDRRVADIGGIGERYFRRHASRRKSAPTSRTARMTP